MGRSVDANLPLWVGAPDDDDGGVSVLVQFETLSAERRAVILSVQLFERDDEDDALYATEDPVVLLTCMLDTGACLAEEASASAFLAAHPWFENRFQQKMDLVRRRARRAVAQRDRDTAARRVLQTASNTMVTFQDLFPADWDLIFGVDDTAYWVIDQYCRNPACPCSSVGLSLYELREGDPVVLGEATVDFAPTPARLKVESVTSVTTDVAQELFDAFFDEHDDRLRQRREEARRAVLRYAAPPREARPASPPSASRPNRNDPCPCGSGNKYKRCCLLAVVPTASRS